MRRLVLAGLLAVLPLAPALVAPALAQEAAGLWTTPEGKARVRVAPCGGALCGSVVSLAEPNDPATGRPKSDKNNPDESRRTRPIVGIALLSGMKPEGEGKWRGSIYNPEDGKTYAATMTLQGSKLEVKGCALSVFCKTQVWSR